MKKFKKILKTALCITLICTMLVTSMGAYSGEVKKIEEKSIMNTNNDSNYIRYTFNSTQKRSMKEDNSEGITNDAIMFVKNLDLAEQGYVHIEEACVDELEEYKKNGIVLKSYTVLVPKANSSTEEYYGTYNGKTYYSDYISEAEYQLTTRGDSKSTSNQETFNNWLQDSIILAIGVSNAKVSVVASLVFSVLGISSPYEIAYGSYNLYYEDHYNIETKIIYRKNSYSKQIGYRAQKGNIRIQHYFNPAPGTATLASYYIDTPIDTYVDLTSNSVSLATISRMIDKNGQIVKNLNSQRLFEYWDD